MDSITLYQSRPIVPPEVGGASIAKQVAHRVTYREAYAASDPSHLYAFIEELASVANAAKVSDKNGITEADAEQLFQFVAIQYPTLRMGEIPIAFDMLFTRTLVVPEMKIGVWNVSKQTLGAVLTEYRKVRTLGYDVEERQQAVLGIHALPEHEPTNVESFFDAMAAFNDCEDGGLREIAAMRMAAIYDRFNDLQREVVKPLAERQALWPSFLQKVLKDHQHNDRTGSISQHWAEFKQPNASHVARAKAYGIRTICAEFANLYSKKNFQEFSQMFAHCE